MSLNTLVDENVLVQCEKTGHLCRLHMHTCTHLLHLSLAVLGREKVQRVGGQWHELGPF